MGKQGPLSGQQVNKYRLGDLLGSGGMGVVYKAQDTQLNRPVAMKVMSPATPVSAANLKLFTQLFQAEALRLASLNHPGHPGIPDIYDYFEKAANWFLVMKFIEGETLNDYLQRRGGQLSVDEVLKIGLQLADVLHYLHLRQPPMIFRDLKPTNVMIVPDGRISLIDFGIARLFTPGKSQDTFVALSRGYAAPEQHGTAQTTVRSDIYSLGATLHYLLSGIDPITSPFHFAPLTIQQPAQLASLIAHMVAFDLANMPASMAEVKDTLESMIDQTENVLSPPSASKLPSTVGTQIFFPASALPPTQIASASSPSGTTLLTYEHLGGWATSVAWSSDGTRLASGGADATARIWDVATGQALLTLLGHTSKIDAIAWSSDGRLLTCAPDDKTVRVWETTSGTLLRQYDIRASKLDAIAWSPDGQKLAFASSKRRFEPYCIHIWEATSGTLQLEYDYHIDYTEAIIWSPDGSLLASTSSRTVQVWEATSGNLLQEYNGHVS